jgi:PAT family beta-lactamase induction signal transducer AmpG
VPLIKKEYLSKPHVWCFTTYFAEGFPYTLIRTISSVFFRDMKVSLQSIGLTSLYGLPWTFKFLWGPQVDEFGTKRRWMLIMQGTLVGMFAVTAFIAPLSWGVQAIAVLFFAGAVIAATHDIAIDGYYMEALDKAGQAKFVGYRVMAYRIAMMTGTGVIVTAGAIWGWFIGFVLAAILLGLVFLYHLFFLPRCETARRPLLDLRRSFLRLKFLLGAALLGLFILGLRRFFQSTAYASLQRRVPILKSFNFATWVGIGLLVALVLVVLLRKRIKASIVSDPESFYSRAFLSFMDREKMGVILAFIILLRAGEFMLSTMVSPFFVDLGIKRHYGWISGGVGLPASIVGAMLGGWMISRLTMRRVLFPFVLAQNLPMLVYSGLAFALAGTVALNTGAAEPQSIGPWNLAAVAVVHGIEQFGGGLGTAVLMTFLMRVCRPQFKAAHYAIGSGLMNVSGLFAGVASGFLASFFGYGYVFAFSFLVSVPAMVLIFFVPTLEKKEA